MACAWRLPHGGDLNIPLCWWNNAWGEKIGPCPLGLSSCLIVSQPWLPFLPTIWGDDWNPTYSNDNDLGMVYYWIYNIAWYHVMSTGVIGTMACWRTCLYDITWNEQKSGDNKMMSPAMAIQVAPCATQTEQTGRRWTSHGNVYHFSPVTNNSQGKIGESSKFSEETSPPRLLQAIQGSRFIEPLMLLLIQLPLAFHLILLIGPQSSMRTLWKSVKISRGSQRIAKAGWKVRCLRVSCPRPTSYFWDFDRQAQTWLGLSGAACPIAIRKHEQGQLLWDPLETLLTWTSNFLTHTTRCAVGISPTHWQLETGAQTRKMKPTEGVLLNHIKSIKANAGLMHIPSGKLT